MASSSKLMQQNCRNLYSCRGLLQRESLKLASEARVEGAYARSNNQGGVSTKFRFLERKPSARPTGLIFEQAEILVRLWYTND